MSNELILNRREGVVAAQDRHKGRSIYTQLFPAVAKDTFKSTVAVELFTEYVERIVIVKAYEFKSKTNVSVGNKDFGKLDDSAYKTIYAQNTFTLPSYMFKSVENINTITDAVPAYKSTYGRIELGLPSYIFGYKDHVAVTPELGLREKRTVIQHKDESNKVLSTLSLILTTERE